MQGMARLRKGVAYRKLERPYTRVSKYKKQSFVKTRPNVHITKYDMGKANGNYAHRVDLISKADFQARHNSLESARQTCNRSLEKQLGKKEFHFKIRLFPHHILRENPLASGAGADRMSTGMSRSFGKVIGTAARVKEGQKMLSVYCKKGKAEAAKTALLKASKKLAAACKVEVVDLTPAK